jgi:hypothetical protein
VTVKGADVTGIQLRLVALSELSGRLILEAARETDRPAGCGGKPPALPEETLILARREERAPPDDEFPFSPFTSQVVPSGQGQFTIRSLEPTRYRLEVRLPGEGWYLRSVTWPGSMPTKQPQDAARDGLTLGPGQQLKEVVVTAAEGAAGLRGQVVAATEGQRLPIRLRVHLVPVEREQADNVLRYAEALAGRDGKFAFTSLAPGRYWLVARAEDEALGAPYRPVAWNHTARAKLRREAEAAGVAVELQPCQRLVDYVLRYPQPPPDK